MAWQSKIDKSNLHPGLVVVMDRALGYLEKAGNPFKVYSGLRTFAEQNELYAIGRTVPGDFVTKAKGGQSMHNYGLALDSAPIKGDGVWWPNKRTDFHIWEDLEKALTKAASAIDRELDDGIDYEWGGRWKFNGGDCPHIQVRTTLTELQAGEYPHCNDVDWLVHAHTTFLFATPWMKRRVQLLLNLQSYNCGAVDGIIGAGTVEALGLFQADQKLEVEKPGGTWAIDKPTVERLVRLHQTSMSLPRGTLPEDLTA